MPWKVKIAIRTAVIGLPGWRVDFIARGLVALGGNRLGDAVGILGADIVSGDQLGEDAQAQQLCPDDARARSSRTARAGRRSAGWLGSSQSTAR